MVLAGRMRCSYFPECSWARVLVVEIVLAVDRRSHLVVEGLVVVVVVVGQ